jgi:hypothetical protein
MRAAVPQALVLFVRSGICEYGSGHRRYGEAQARDKKIFKKSRWQ